MKRTTLIMALILISISAFAQEENEIKTLLGGGITSHGGYGGLSVAYSNIDERDAILVGGRGAWLINHKVGIGLAGYGFLTESRFDNVLNNRYQLAGGYGGLFLEYILNPKSPIHLSFPLTIGAGGVTYTRNNGTFLNDIDGFYGEDSEAFFVVEPGVEVEINLIKFMRIAFGASYRYTSNIGLNYFDGSGAILEEEALRGFNAGITLKFGKF